ncbi:alpha/beta hydrolase [Modestobacter sp. URMC 112]
MGPDRRRRLLERRPAAGVTTLDRLAAGGERDVPVRLYVPRGPAPAGGRPLVVAIPGGRWVRGGVGASVWPCGRIATRVGAVVVHVGCRVAPEHPAPAAHLDAYAATAWLAERATRFGARPDRLAVLGDGPGATVAATVALDARDRGRPAIAFQVLVRPATDLTLAALGPVRPPARTGGAPLPGEADVRQWADRYLGELADPLDPLVSPLLAEDHRGLPPALVVTAEHDPLRGDGLRYLDALLAGGVRAEHAEAPMGGPSRPARGRPPVDPALEAVVVSALRRALT